MNAVGIDVSKGKSMVAIMRPFGEIVSAPFEIKHTASDINSLVELINSVWCGIKKVDSLFSRIP